MRPRKQQKPKTKTNPNSKTHKNKKTHYERIKAENLKERYMVNICSYEIPLKSVRKQIQKKE